MNKRQAFTHKLDAEVEVLLWADDSSGMPHYLKLLDRIVWLTEENRIALGIPARAPEPPYEPQVGDIVRDIDLGVDEVIRVDAVNHQMQLRRFGWLSLSAPLTLVYRPEVTQ